MALKYLVRPKTKSLHDRLLIAALTSNIKEINFCLQKKINPNIKFRHNEGVIHIAAEKGDVAMGKVLVEAPNIDLNMQNDHGDTALIIASMGGKKLFVRLLLRKNADPNITNRKGQTPLQLAVFGRQLSILADLIKSGAKINAVDAFGNTPLSIACIDAPNLDIANYLLKKGARTDVVTGKPLPLLMEMVLNCDSLSGIELLSILLEYGADINISNDITKRNCLHIVGLTGYAPVALYLLNNGANIQQLDLSYRSPIDMAVEHENWDVANVFYNWLTVLEARTD